MQNIKKRNAKGSTLAIAAACFMIIVFIGIGFAYISMAVGSKKQTEHAVQNGSLSLMNAACKIAVPYSSLTAKQQEIVHGAFAGKPPEGIDLINYNQVIGYAMRQAQNAINGAGGENGQQYKEAQVIIDAIQNDSDSIGQRLIAEINKKINDPSFVETNFSSVANANPSGLYAFFGGGNKIQLRSCTPVYVNQYGSSTVPISNVSIDLNSSAYDDLAQWAQGGPDTSKTNPDNKQPYTFVSGYTAIEPNILAGSSGGAATPYRTLYAISINPNEPVHLVAASEVTTPTSKVSKATGGKMPPFNGLNLIADVQGSGSNANYQTSVFVVAGGQTSSETPMLPPSVPGGYITVKNAAPLNFPSIIEIVDIQEAPEANELMTGVYITGTAAPFGYPLFSTDQKTLQAWAKYNYLRLNNKSATKPATNADQPIFNIGGAIASNEELEAIRYVNTKDEILGVGVGLTPPPTTICSECFWNNFEGKLAKKACQDLKTSFTMAYGVPKILSSFSPQNITSAEAAKGAYLAAYQYATKNLAEYDFAKQKTTTSSTIFVNVRKGSGFGGVAGDPGEDQWITTTTTTESWNKTGTALTLAATKNIGECINNIGKTPDSDFYVGVSGLQKFPHDKMLYASGTNGSGDFLSFMSTVAKAPTNPADVKSIKVGQDGTILDYISEVSVNHTPGVAANAPIMLTTEGTTVKRKVTGPLAELLKPVTTSYPFATIAQYANGTAKVTPGKALQTRDKFAAELKKQMTIKNGKIGALMQAMHQIVPNKDPEIFGGEVYDILTGQTIGLDQTMYIYADQNNKDSQGQPKLILTKTPPGNNANQVPNGKIVTFRNSYAVMGKTVNPKKEMAIVDSLFTKLTKLSGASKLRGVDEITWTPNTGSNNYLGELSFSSGLTGMSTTDFNMLLRMISQSTTKNVVSMPN